MVSLLNLLELFLEESHHERDGGRVLLEKTSIPEFGLLSKVSTTLEVQIAVRTRPGLLPDIKGLGLRMICSIMGHQIGAQLVAYFAPQGE